MREVKRREEEWHEIWRLIKDTRKGITKRGTAGKKYTIDREKNKKSKMGEVKADA